MYNFKIILVLIISLSLIFQLKCTRDNECELNCQEKEDHIEGYWKKIYEETVNLNGNINKYIYTDAISFDTLNQGWYYSLSEKNILKQNGCFEWKLDCSKNRIHLKDDIWCNGIRGIDFVNEYDYYLDFISKSEIKFHYTQKSVGSIGTTIRNFRVVLLKE